MRYLNERQWREVLEHASVSRDEGAEAVTTTIISACGDELMKIFRLADESEFFSMPGIEIDDRDLETEFRPLVALRMAKKRFGL